MDLAAVFHSWIDPFLISAFSDSNMLSAEPIAVPKYRYYTLQIFIIKEIDNKLKTIIFNFL